jgi:tetratricopeptide (TPR) repeat protein
MPLAMSLAASLALLMQVGPNPAAGATPDYSADVQDRPPRERDVIGAFEPVPPSIANSWLKNCLELVETDPARAHVQAQVRVSQTSGDKRVLANHCLGLASTGLGRWTEAQSAFASARDEVPAKDARLRARLGAMAANAATANNDPNAALAYLTQARFDASQAQSTGQSADDLMAIIAKDEARALVALGRLQDAEASLKQARQLKPSDAESALLLATLLRRMERLDEAQKQIEDAYAIVPLDPAVGLEAGLIAVLDGREEAAKISWNSVLKVAPDSPQAETARGYLAQLEPQPTQ